MTRAAGDTIEVDVLYFARARDLAGRERDRLELRRGGTVSQARDAIAATRPALAELLSRCRFAIDCEFASDDAIVEEGAELAVLPPVSGG